MHRPIRWNTAGALKFYSARAALFPNDWEKRFNWESVAEDGSDGFTQAEMDAIYTEVIAKIPGGVTRVLEVGCGDGRFGNVLKTALPAVEYRGIDLVPDNIERAQENYPNLDFVPGNLWEYLPEAAADWDFIVSIGCLFSVTDVDESSRLFELVDSKAPKGFVILADPIRLSEEALIAGMGSVLAASDTVSASYATGERDFLLDATVKGVLRPFYVQRAGTSTTTPELLPRMSLIEGGRANKILERTRVRISVRAGGEAATEFKGFTSSGGLITAIEEAKPVDPEVKTKIPPRRANLVFTPSSEP